MKAGSLQATQFGSETCFTAGHPIRQRKLFHFKPHDSAAKLFCCRPPNLIVKAISLQATQFDSKHAFDSEC
jgi:hypothetical protein